ncbi:PD-(D/E)XK nuclease domain-containing protein [Amycolatopsis sp. NPDC054798]
MALLEGEDKATFNKLYDGSTFSPAAKAFTEAPTQASIFANQSQEGSPFQVSAWQWEVERYFVSNFNRQCDILEQQIYRSDDSSVGTTQALEQLEATFRRFPSVANFLGKANKNSVGLSITDEYDLQRIVGGVLFAMFDDVRPEDPTEQFAGGSSRIDFVLKREKVAIEVKCTRPSMTLRKLREELLSDLSAYPHHSGAEGVFILVYDKEHIVANAVGFEDDLAQTRADMKVAVVVTR